MSTGEHDDTADAAESFVTTFYHNSDDEIYTDGEEDGNIFELYGTSRPLTPLEHKNPEGTTTDRTQYSDDPSDQISIIDSKNTTFHENGRSARTPDTASLDESSMELSQERGDNFPSSSPKKSVSGNEALKSSAEENTPVEDA